MSGGAWDRLAGARAMLLACLALLLAAAAPAPAQAPQPPQIVRGVFGWEGFVAPGRPWPLLLELRGGSEPFDGVLAATYVQDVTQEIEVLTPVSLAPGRVTRVTLALHVPQYGQQVNVRLLTLGSREVASLKFDRWSDASDVVNITEIPAQSVCVGILEGAGLEKGTVQAAIPARGGVSDPNLQPARGIAIPLAEFPIHDAALRGLELLVVPAAAADRLEPRSLAAVRQWVCGGGRLVVLADDPGASWRAWLPPGTLGDLVEIGPAATISTPPSLTALVPSAAPTLAGRPIRLTERGRRDGWRTTHPLEGDAALQAEGPVGFGLVTVLGYAPRRVPDPYTPAAAAPLWNETIRSTLNGGRTAQASWGGGAFRTPETDDAISRAVTHLGSSVLPLGWWPPTLMAICLALLALMLGPGDYFALGRLRQRHRSWLTALVWIALAAGATYAVPNFIRSAETTVQRLEVVDHLAEPGAPLVWQSAASGIFAGTGLDARWIDLPEAGTWDGVSAGGGGGGSALGRPKFAVVQIAPAAEAEPEPWGGMTPGAAGSCLPQPGRMPVRAWTFRTFMDEARKRPAIVASAGKIGDELVIRLGGLPPGARADGAAVLIGDAWFEAEVAADGVPAASGSPAGAAPGTFTVRVTRRMGPPFSWDASADEADGVVRLTNLPGAAQRLAGLYRRVTAGRWGLLMLRLTDNGGPTIESADLTTRTTLARIVFVVPEGWTMPPGAAWTPPKPGTARKWLRSAEDEVQMPDPPPDAAAPPSPSPAEPRPAEGGAGEGPAPGGSGQETPG